VIIFRHNSNKSNIR